MHVLLATESERPINIIFEYLWFPELANFCQVSKKCYELGTRPAVGHSMFYKLLQRTHRYTRSAAGDPKSELINIHEESWFLLARRIPSWPQCVDFVSLNIVPRNVRVMSSRTPATQIRQYTSCSGKKDDDQRDNARISDCCVVYGGRKRRATRARRLLRLMTTSRAYLGCLLSLYSKVRTH